ncbi:MFS transporter [Alkalihalobacterium chitinilyticum]|uniref:MFS transporter n=1 Tax=Alkalihalobacterium chitinilyticum TaxID=2980103 RepID=A0ABT5VGE6_9BACI|nr:MFS transporter [Alkalihalobacterium chitinilyticum]MDE5414535.1 MFS transporter [Alkalihalobacterium chitinilyticum]
MNNNISKKQYIISESEKKKLISLLCILLLFSIMNSTMFMVSVPDIAFYFDLLPSQVSWVVTGYIILYSIGALLYGKLGDIFPIKNLLTFGIALFVLGSIFGFFSPNYLMVVISRMIQACGAAAIIAIVFVIPSRYFPHEKGQMLGILSSAMAFGAGLGPVLGGFIAGFLDWHYIFLFSFVVVLTLPFIRVLLPKEEKKSGKPDVIGAILMAAGVALFILFITTFNWIYFLLSTLIIGSFFWWIFHYKHPLILPEMFKNKVFRLTVLTSFFGTLIMFSNLFILPLLLREVHSLSTIQIGLVLFPGAILGAFVGRVAGGFTDRFGSHSVGYFAITLILIGSFLLSSFVGFAPWIISLIFSINFIAFPIFQTSMANLISSVLPDDQMGVGMGIYNLGNLLSGAVGGAIIGRILDYSFIGISLNPFIESIGIVVVYSNIFVGMALLTIFIGLYFYLSNRKHQMLLLRDDVQFEPISYKND